MRNVVRSLFLAVAALALGCCVEATEVITVNPDGSGKIQIDETMATPPNFGPGGPGGAKPDPDKLAKTAVGQTLANKAIEAWSDVSYEVLNDGRIHVKATGYFKDVTKLGVLPGQPPQADQGFRWSKNDKGGMDLVLKTDKAPATAPASQPKLTDEQVSAKVKEAKMQYQQMKPMMAMMLGTLKIDMTFVLPGKLQEVNNFKKTDKGVQLVIEGKKMLEVMDKSMTDDKALEALVRAGKKADDQPENFNEMMFGSKGEIMARVGGDLKPVFDYAAEMGKAKAGQDEMLKKLGVEIKAPGLNFGGPASAN